MLRIVKFGVMLLALSGLWAGLLWFGIAPAFAQYSPLALIGMHALPPLALTGGISLLIQQRQLRRARDAQAAVDARAEEESLAAAAAKERHARELAQRQFGVPVLAITFAGWLERGGSDAVTPGAEAVAVLPCDEVEAHEDVADCSEANVAGDDLGLALPLADALAETYALCPGAAAFALYVRGPGEWSGKQSIDVVRAALADRRLPFSGADAGHAEGIPFPVVHALPAAAGVGEALVGLFDEDSGLPGAVVLAFDSPHARTAASADEAEELAPAEVERRRWLGLPAQGVVALVLGNPALGAMVAQVEAARAGAGEGVSGAEEGTGGAVMRPYWESGNTLTGALVPLAALSPPDRLALTESMPLGSLHRPVAGECVARPGRVNALAEAARRAVERALVNARLTAAPGAPSPAEGASPSMPGADASEVATPACDWLVHNAGGIDCSGPRLAALSLALHAFGIDLNPIDEATNFPARVGNLGAALPLALVAQAINKAAEVGSAACWVEFSGAETFHLGFVVPASAPLSANATV